MTFSSSIARLFFQKPNGFFLFFAFSAFTHIAVAGAIAYWPFKKQTSRIDLQSTRIGMVSAEEFRKIAKLPAPQSKKTSARENLLNILKRAQKKKTNDAIKLSKKKLEREFQNKLKTARERAKTAQKSKNEKTGLSGSQKSAFLAKGLSQGDLKTLRQQMRICWTPPIGAANAEDLIISAKLKVNPDGSIASVALKEPDAKLRAHPYYSAAAESVLRALRNPSCAILDLPKNKYRIWKEITLIFNPKHMASLS